MEVHHHPNLHHKRKTFKEYFLEFLMIFLAVTMGFFAESYREHLVDNRNEREIISALFSDIKKDTANLNTIINRYMPEHVAWEDSAGTYIKSVAIKGNDRKVAKALINATNWNFYSPPQVSLDILKNSGTFNLVKSKKIKTEIINFNALINTYENYSQFTLASEHAVDTATAGIIDRSSLRTLIAAVYLKTNAEYGSITDSDIPANTTLKTYDKKVYINYMNKLDAMDYLLNDLLGLYKKILNNGNGIPQKVVDKIFQPFFTTKPTGQGTGLGLSLSYDIIKAHGGEIKVETKEDEFTEFIIQLPIST